MKLFKKVLIIGMATMALGSSVAFGCDGGKINSGDQDKNISAPSSDSQEKAPVKADQANVPSTPKK